MMKENKIDWRIVVVGMLCLTALEMVALFMGVNGVLLTIVLALIAGAIGLTLPQVKMKS